MVHRITHTVAQGGRLAMAEAFSHLLGNTSCLQRTALVYRWNVAGPLATAAVGLFGGQAKELFRALSPIAARIRFMGQIALPDETDVVLSGPEQLACAVNADALALARILETGHRKTIVSIQAAADIAWEIEDRGSLAMLDARLLAHEGHIAELQVLSR